MAGLLPERERQAATSFRSTKSSTRIGRTGVPQGSKLSPFLFNYYHLHQESLTLRVKDHSYMLSAQYLVNCLEEDHVCHGITTQEPRPMKDKEQRLNRRQRCTLSQLRSGHCHLLQDYTHRVLCEPSDICTDCGALPQDVRHLFACTTQPSDLSPEDLWQNLVGSIRAFSYLDKGNLD